MSNGQRYSNNVVFTVASTNGNSPLAQVGGTLQIIRSPTSDAVSFKYWEPGQYNPAVNPCKDAAPGSDSAAWCAATGAWDEVHDCITGSTGAATNLIVFLDRGRPAPSMPAIHVYVRDPNAQPDDGEWVGHGGTP